MNSYVVAIRETEQDGQVYTLLLDRIGLADLLVNVDSDKFEIGDIISTYSEKADTVIPFCKLDENLTTGETNDSE